MTKQMTYLADDENQTIGWLVYWTIQEGEFDLATVVKQAQTSDVPQYLQDRLTARDIDSAFTAATQLGANGVKVGKNGTSLRRIVTRNAIPGETKTRALVLETTDPTQTVSKWVTGKTVCIIELLGSRMDVTWSNWINDDPYRLQMHDLVDDMERTMYNIEGRIDDGRIRSALLAYLDRQHKVTVRGSGGVYFIPHAPTFVSKDDMEQELLAIMDWLQKAVGSSFSIVAIQERGAFNKPQLQEDAISTIKGELKDIQSKLEAWANTPAMNAGSKHYSAGTQLDRIVELEEMTAAFKESLGEKVGIVEEMTNMVKSRLVALRKETSRQMDTDKEARLARRRQKRAEKKAGTARDRNRKRVL